MAAMLERAEDAHQHVLGFGPMFAAVGVAGPNPAIVSPEQQVTPAMPKPKKPIAGPDRPAWLSRRARHEQG